MKTQTKRRHAVAAPFLLAGLVGSLTLSGPSADAAAVDPRLEADKPSTPAFTVGQQIVMRPAAVMPVTNYRLTGRFGNSGSRWARTHTGLDFASPYGSPIRAVVSGTVLETGYDGAYGKKTVIRDDKGVVWWFCHQSQISVHPGEHVLAGEVIGYVGSTGNSTGPHLHLEVRPSEDNPVDPQDYLAGLGLKA